MMRVHECLKTLVCLFGVVTATGMMIACEGPRSDRAQGYVEGEYVYVASPFAGAS